MTYLGSYNIHKVIYPFADIYLYLMFAITPAPYVCFLKEIFKSSIDYICHLSQMPENFGTDTGVYLEKSNWPSYKWKRTDLFGPGLEVGVRGVMVKILVNLWSKRTFRCRERRDQSIFVCCWVAPNWAQAIFPAWCWEVGVWGWRLLQAGLMIKTGSLLQRAKHLLQPFKR